MIEFRVLGALDLRDAATDEPVRSVLAQPKRTALLVYLALASPRGPHQREALLPLFWPESSEERARNSLNQAVFHLRRSLGEAAIEGTGEQLGLAAPVVWCDAAAFEDALTARDAERALDLYAGELLPGFHVDGCPDFERWLERRRERLRGQAVEAALARAEALEADGGGIAAVELLRRAESWAPYDERVAGRIIALLDRLGDRAEALRTYERYRASLAADLELVPPAAVETLAAAVRRGDDRAARKPVPRPATYGPDIEFSVPAPDAAASAAAQTAPGAAPARSARPIARLHFAGGIAAAAAVAAALLVSVWIGAWPDPAVTVVAGVPELDSRRVLVAAFENRTGDPDLDPLGLMAADWIAQALARSGLARVVPFSTVVQETPHLSAADAAPEVAFAAANRQLARRIQAGLLVAGGYYRSGDAIVFQAQVIDVRTGELLRAIEEVHGSVDRAAAAAEELQRRCLGAMATLFDERLHSWPDPGDQPSSLDAYRLFDEGMDRFMRAVQRFGSPEQASLHAEAAELFSAAARIDTAFTAALLWAGYAYLNAGDTGGAHNVGRALEGRPLSPWGAAVLANQRAMLARDLEAEYVTALELASLSPDSEWLFKLALAAYRTGRPREALETFLRMHPERGWLRTFPSYWRLRTEVRHVVGDHPGALEDARRALAVHPDDDWLITQELWALAALGRVHDIERRVVPRIAAGDALALWQLGTTLEELHGHGHRAAAGRLLARAVPLAENLAAADPRRRAELARLLDLAGRPDDAATLYHELLAQRPHDGEVRVRLAMLALRAPVPDFDRASAALAWLDDLEGLDLARAVPVGQLGYWGSPAAWRAMAQARILAGMMDGDRAVARLRAAVAEGLRHTYLHLHDDPDFDPLRDHPGFRELIRPRG